MPKPNSRQPLLLFRCDESGGRVDYRHLPSVTTLNTLAQFAGYVDWRQFVRSFATNPESETQADPPPAILVKRSVNWRRIGWILGTVTAIGLLAFDQRHYSGEKCTLTASNTFRKLS